MAANGTSLVNDVAVEPQPTAASQKRSATSRVAQLGAKIKSVAISDKSKSSLKQKRPAPAPPQEIRVANDRTQALNQYATNNAKGEVKPIPFSNSAGFMWFQEPWTLITRYIMNLQFLSLKAAVQLSSFKGNIEEQLQDWIYCFQVTNFLDLIRSIGESNFLSPSQIFFFLTLLQAATKKLSQSYQKETCVALKHEVQAAYVFHVVIACG